MDSAVGSRVQDTFVSHQTTPPSIKDAAVTSLTSSITPSLTAMAPPHGTMPAALCVPELLEHVLRYLPQKDLFTCMRVCQKFNTAIKDSTKLKRQLWLVPVTWKGAPPVLNTTRNFRGEICAPSAESDYLVVDLNPAMTISKNGIKYRQSGEVDVLFNINDDEITPDSSFLNQLVCQPSVPIMKAEVWIVAETEYTLYGFSTGENAEPTFKDFQNALVGAKEEFKRQRDEKAGVVENMRWMLTFPGGLKFRHKGQMWPPQKKKKDATTHADSGDKK